MGIPWGIGYNLPFVFAIEDKGFGFVGGEMGDATGEDGWANYFVGVVATPTIATEGDPIIFDGDDRGDFDNGEFGPLGNVSTEVESERSLSGLTARAFLLIPFGAGGGEDGFVVCVAIDETTGSTGGEEGEDSLLCCFETEGVAFESLEGLFFEAPLSRVLPI